MKEDADNRCRSNQMGRLIGISLITIVCMAWIAGCSTSTIGKEKISDVYIEKDQAEQLDVNLTIDYGQVDINAGADAWVDGDIKYNVAELEPKITYKLKRKNGKITIDQPNKTKINVKKGALKNDWDLHLTKDVPVHLKVKTGASDTSMNLASMQLQSLNIETGVGKNTLNLGGTWEESLGVKLELGVGESTIILPKDVGVKIKSSKGIGSATFSGFTSNGKGIYVNDAFEHADVIIYVETELGIGAANFELED